MEYLEDEGMEGSIDDIMETAHWVAFKGGELARSKGANDDGLSDTVMQNYRNRFLNRKNAVLVGMNVEHEEFVKQAEAALAVLPEGSAASVTPTKYVGGESHMEVRDHPRFALAFGSGGYNSSKDFFCSAILQEVLGSTANRLYRKPRPGHGLTSRLNKELSGLASVLYAESFATAYSDAGLFGVSAQAISGDEGVVVEKVATQLSALAKTPLADAELQAAKNGVKMSFYERSEDVLDKSRFYARQALYSNQVMSADSYISKIDSISKADVQNAAKKMFSQGVTFVSEGSSNNYPTISHLQSVLNN